MLTYRQTRRNPERESRAPPVQLTPNPPLAKRPKKKAKTKNKNVKMPNGDVVVIGGASAACRGARNPPGQRLCWLNSLLSVLCRLLAFTDLLQTVAHKHGANPIVGGIKKFHDDIEEGNDGNTVQLIKDWEKEGLISSQKESQNPQRQLFKLVAYLDRVTDDTRFRDLFNSTVVFEHSCARCGTLRSRETVERPVWEIVDSFRQQGESQGESQQSNASQQSRRPTSSESQTTTELESPPQKIINEYLVDAGRPRLSTAQLYRAGFSQLSTPKHCYDCGMDTEMISTVKGGRHGPILVLHVLHYEDADIPDVDIAASFNDPMAADPWQLAHVVLYHAPGTYPQGHVSSIVQHGGGWYHVSDHVVKPIKSRAAHHTTVGQRPPYPLLVVYTKEKHDYTHRAKEDMGDGKRKGHADMNEFRTIDETDTDQNEEIETEIEAEIETEITEIETEIENANNTTLAVSTLVLFMSDSSLSSIGESVKCTSP